MKIPVWIEGVSTAEEGKDIAYWERNVLALLLASMTGGGWYNDDVVVEPSENDTMARRKPRYEKWRRVISCRNGAITYHIPDSFPIGDLPQIERNWDGHDTTLKYARILNELGISVET